MKTETTKQEFVIRFDRSGKYVVDAPPTGYTSSFYSKKAIKFSSSAEAEAFRMERGIFNVSIVLMIT